LAETLAAATIATASYAPQAAVMAESLQRFHPGLPLYFLLAGPPRPLPHLERLGVRIVPLTELRLPGAARMLLRSSPKELCAALKPAWLKELLRRGHHTAVFLDPDMLVLASLEPLFEAAAGHSLTLTPHLLPEAAAAPDPALERALLMAGMFNAGVIGATCTEETLRFLDWWERRLRTHCLEDVQRAFHYDQRWLDLAPAFVADLFLLRDPGINAAYWRLPWLGLQLREGAFYAGEQPLRLFHFSGYDPRRPEEVTRFRPGWRVEESGAAELFRLYHRLLLEAGWNEAYPAESGGPELWRVRHFLRRLRAAARLARRNPRLFLQGLKNAGSRRASHPPVTRCGNF
jgi:hypothetical protein